VSEPRSRPCAAERYAKYRPDYLGHTAHSLLSFFFNVTLLALAINLTASAIGNLASS
jgi:hypothetical protein